MESLSRLTVRYAETDRMGVVHHSRYAVWFEIGRTDFMKDAGISYAKMEEEGVWLPVVSLECHFLSPARYDDNIIVKTRLTSLTNVKLGFSYTVEKEGGQRPIVTGKTVQAFTNPSMKPIALKKISPELYSRIKSLLEQ